MVLPPHNTEVSSVVVWSVVLKWSYIGKGCIVFFKPLSKCSWRLAYVFLIAFHSVTLVNQEEWHHHIQIQMWQGGMQWGIHSWVFKNIWREVFNEQLKLPSQIYDHFNTTGHTTTLENFSVVGRGDQNLIRLIKEAVYIRVNNPSLNKYIGKYHLPHIWDEVLFNISELKIK